MSWKNIKQQSFAEALLVEHDALTELDEVLELIDWTRIEVMLSGIHNKASGEKTWPPLLMFKAMLLQSWYKLSDPQLEKQVARDLLFRRFIGLSLSETVPDHSSFWRFRNHPQIIALQASLLGENKQDAEAGYNVKVASDGKLKTTYGYKAHCNVDEEGLIKATNFTAGNVHDSQCFTDLISGCEEQVYADSAYASEKTNQYLKAQQIENCVLERAYRNKPLTAAQKAKNKIKSHIRSTVERTFGILKQHYAMGQARYLGLVRNQVRFSLMCVAYNIKRGVSLRRECQTWQESCA